MVVCSLVIDCADRIERRQRPSRLAPGCAWSGSGPDCRVSSRSIFRRKLSPMSGAARFRRRFSPFLRDRSPFFGSRESSFTFDSANWLGSSLFCLTRNHCFWFAPILSHWAMQWKIPSLSCQWSVFSSMFCLIWLEPFQEQSDSPVNSLLYQVDTDVAKHWSVPELLMLEIVLGFQSNQIKANPWNELIPLISDPSCFNNSVIQSIGQTELPRSERIQRFKLREKRQWNFQ